jgi:hypothetical protein
LAFRKLRLAAAISFGLSETYGDQGGLAAGHFKFAKAAARTKPFFRGAALAVVQCRA